MQYDILIGNLLYEIFVSQNTYSAFWIICSWGILGQGNEVLLKKRAVEQGLCKEQTLYAIE